MAKGKSISKSGRTPDRPHRVASYFASLTLCNMRCFGEQPQTIDLCDHQGVPARWTILLGDNGCGKTTLLQVLAAFDRTSAEMTHYPENEKQVVDAIRGL